jgi:hypothetical protein
MLSLKKVVFPMIIVVIYSEYKLVFLCKTNTQLYESAAINSDAYVVNYKT